MQGENLAMRHDNAEPENVLRTIVLRLAKPTPLLNRTIGLHWAKRRQRNRAMAWEVKIALKGQQPASPFQRTRVTVERRSIGVPDADGLIGGLKGLLDSLLPMSKTHPYGLGLIQDDSPAHLDLVPRGVRVAHRVEECTIITIEEVAL